MALRIEFTECSATVELAAKALYCEPQRIAKTISFYVGNGVVLIVTAGDAKVDNRKYKTQFGVKMKMLDFADTRALIGHAAGAVCPFAVNDGVETYLDISLRRFKTVFPAGGSPNSGIELTIAELEKYSECRQWIDVCKEWHDKGVS